MRIAHFLQYLLFAYLPILVSGCLVDHSPQFSDTDRVENFVKTAVKPNDSTGLEGVWLRDDNVFQKLDVDGYCYWSYDYTSVITPWKKEGNLLIFDQIDTNHIVQLTTNTLWRKRKVEAKYNNVYSVRLSPIKPENIFQTKHRNF